MKTEKKVVTKKKKKNVVGEVLKVAAPVVGLILTLNTGGKLKGNNQG